MIDQEELSEQILARAQQAAVLDWTNVNDTELNRYIKITQDLSVYTHLFSIKNAIMRAFLAYAIVCATGTLVGLRFFHVEPMIMVFSNLLIAAAVAGWMTYGLHVFSANIKAVFADYDSFIKRTASKEIG